MRFFRPKHLKKRDVSEKAIKEGYPEFSKELLGRLEVGSREYGDASFEGPIENLIKAIMEECLDIAGWGFILWFRLRRLQLAYAKLVARIRREAK